ncbi:MAG: hypothetical protein RRA35_05715 [Desulfomonilia bacterium]|nr:hypothetical protein [Desulfomonilia bacterium]
MIIVFIQITCKNSHDIPIPAEAGSRESSISFGILKTTQALGDWHASKDSGRTFLRIHVGDEVIPGAISKVAELFLRIPFPVVSPFLMMTFRIILQKNMYLELLD